jgi:hypothetical protein
MGKYIGRSNPYGLFETQVLNAGTGSGSGPTSYNLTYRVSSASSLLVVKAGNILQPETEYTLSNSIHHSALSIVTFICNIFG